MAVNTPQKLKIYHIVHIDRLEQILCDSFLYSDAHMRGKLNRGTTIGMNKIKERRQNTFLRSYPDLTVGQCVPFYFCSRSVMLYVIHCGNHLDLAYKGGQNNIIHLEFDLHKVRTWAQDNNKRCVFTNFNASSSYFEDCSDFSQLGKINWKAIRTNKWENVKEEKQAEFLIEDKISFDLVERIGVCNSSIYQKVSVILDRSNIDKLTEIKNNWYY